LEGGINLFAYVQNDPINFVDQEGLEPAPCSAQKYTPVFPDDYRVVYDKNGDLYALGDDGNYERVELILAELPIGPSKLIKGLDATKKVQDLLKGTGQIPALLRNKNLAGVDTQGLLNKTLQEAKKILTKKQFKTFMKHFEGRNLRHGK
jgi:hypothetical protein